MDYWQQRGYTPNISFHSNSFEAIRSLVAKGRGITILSDQVYRPWSLDGLRVMHSTIDDFITYMDIGTVKKAARPLTPEAVKVIDFLRQAVTRLDKPF
ncbi:LysR substrate-binding domain-containing protein [Citrobacter sp. Cu231]|uniref:LysR substrate-binding domain-containing protein n=1 Tax=Citrobacter sp. Cu231 TaxID=2985159 RepID=UPI002575893B|nr:LysR substrate-binding domain-containing protein [Citrobacter sp. Cu231]MDM2743419.1 LysR substrate-binding domain-containing protein [Citrobacter sp. Cu231]